MVLQSLRPSPAGPGSPPMWAIGRPESAIIAFIIRQMPITRLERCFLCSSFNTYPTAPAPSGGSELAGGDHWRWIKRRQGTLVMRTPGSHRSSSEYGHPARRADDAHGQSAGACGHDLPAKRRSRTPSPWRRLIKAPSRRCWPGTKAAMWWPPFWWAPRAPCHGRGSSMTWAMTSSPSTSRGRDRYIVTDIYALKYIEFYDTRRREQCEAMLKQNGLWNRG